MELLWMLYVSSLQSIHELERLMTLIEQRQCTWENIL